MKTSTLSLLLLLCVHTTIGSPEKCSFKKGQYLTVHGREGTCQNTCDLNPKCTHYEAEPLVYHYKLGSLERCKLMNGNVSWSDSKPTSGKRYCGIRNFLKPIGEDYMGSNCLFEFQQYRVYPLESGEDCFQLCKEHSRCTHFNFIKDHHQRACHLMVGLHKGPKGAALVIPKYTQAISCGYMTDNKMEKIENIEETTPVQPELLQDDYSYLYYVCFFLAGLLSALVLYLLSCTCAKSVTTSDEI